MNDAALRAHVVKLLDWKEAHATFDAAVAGVPVKMRGAVPRRWEYSIWQLVEPPMKPVTPYLVRRNSSNSC